MNVIFESLSGLDDDLIEMTLESIKRGRRRKIALKAVKYALIGAAAAAACIALPFGIAKLNGLTETKPDVTESGAAAPSADVFASLSDIMEMPEEKARELLYGFMYEGLEKMWGEPDKRPENGYGGCWSFGGKEIILEYNKSGEVVGVSFGDVDTQSVGLPVEFSLPVEVRVHPDYQKSISFFTPAAYLSVDGKSYECVSTETFTAYYDEGGESLRRFAERYFGLAGDTLTYDRLYELSALPADKVRWNIDDKVYYFGKEADGAYDICRIDETWLVQRDYYLVEERNADTLSSSSCLVPDAPDKDIIRYSFFRYSESNTLFASAARQLYDEWKGENIPDIRSLAVIKECSGDSRTYRINADVGSGSPEMLFGFLDSRGIGRELVGTEITGRGELSENDAQMTEFISSPEGIGLNYIAVEAAYAWLSGNRERLCEYLADPSYDTGIANGADMTEQLEYFAISYPYSFSGAPYSAARDFFVNFRLRRKNGGMDTYLCFVIRNVGGEYKIVFVEYQG